MVRSIVNVAAVLAATIATASAAPMPTGTWPASTGTVKYSAPHVVKAGTTFDGAMKTYERSNVQCTDQAEGGSAGAVFLVEPGATLKNVIIGKAQTEGVHCDQGGCTIQNVWWDDVCEDALSIKGGSASSVTKVIGGGARYAEDKVIQHNGYGSVSIDGFYVQDFGKLFRACGNCKTKIQRKVSVANVYAVNPKVGIVTVNKNYGDEAKLSNIKIKTSKATSKVEVCAWSQAVTSGEPKKLGHGPSPPLCQYSTSAVTFTK
ncbi:Pectate lyase, partial [Globisporangium splendens]